MNMRKKYQRKFNKLIRLVNKTIEDDSLWRGRFVVYQTDASFHKFKDNSGGILYLNLRFIDKLTNFYWDCLFDYAPYIFSKNHIFGLMNKFIVEYNHTWDENPALKPSCRGIPVSFDWHKKEKNYFGYRGEKSNE